MTDIVRTIKPGNCSSLSGRTTLTYHVGWLEGKIYFRLHENSSGGLFSKEWVSLERLGIEEGKPISSISIQSLFNNRSANTGGFLLSVLIKEGLIMPVEEKRRSYQCCDPTAFMAAIQALVESEAPAESPKSPRQMKKRGAAVTDIGDTFKGEYHNESRTIE